VDEIIPWFHQQIEAAEASTRTLLYWAQQTILTLQEPRLLGKEIPGWHDWPNVEKMCHQRLAELAAMREAVKACEEDLRQRGDGALGGRVDRPTWDVVASLASAFASQPGYQERWRPGGSSEPPPALPPPHSFNPGSGPGDPLGHLCVWRSDNERCGHPYDADVHRGLPWVRG
jgi:hypothetical protein